MTIFKAFCITLSIVTLVSISIGAYFIHDLNNFQTLQCEHIADIANDEKAVAYLDNWAKENVINKNYYFVTGMHRHITAYSTDGSTVDLKLPEESKSRIEQEHFRFGLDKIGGNHKTSIKSDNVGELLFGRGRNSIILLKNGHTLKSHRGNDEASGHLLKINDSTFAYCEDARF